jgi:tetratricopeptide (TPR) repeat protein
MPCPQIMRIARIGRKRSCRALGLDPTSRIAVVMLGQLAFDEGRLEEAREWYRKALAAEPRNADIWCTLGTIAQQQWLRQDKPAHHPILDEAIADFEKAAALAPVHEVAMQYLSLLLRERAGTRDASEEGRKDLAAADRWLEKSADARSEKIQAANARIVSRPDIGGPDPLLKQWALLAVSPPPAPAKGGPASGAPVSRGVISWEPTVRSADQAPPIRVAPAVQARKLVTKVDPEYAAGARAED